MLSEIMKSDYAELGLIVINEQPESEQPTENKSLFDKIKNNSGRLPHVLVKKVLLTAYSKLIDRTSYLPDAFEPVDCEVVFSDIPTIKVATRKTKWSDYFSDDDVGKIKEQEVDIFIRCGFGILRGGILNSAKYGVWSFHHGDNIVNRGGPAGYWESMESWNETGSVLQILSEDLDNGQVLYRSFSSTNSMSVRDNKNNFFWKSLSFIPRKMEELHRIGEEAFFKKV